MCNQGLTLCSPKEKGRTIYSLPLKKKNEMNILFYRPSLSYEKLEYQFSMILVIFLQDIYDRSYIVLIKKTPKYQQHRTGHLLKIQNLTFLVCLIVQFSVYFVFWQYWFRCQLIITKVIFLNTISKMIFIFYLMQAREDILLRCVFRIWF